MLNQSWSELLVIHELMNFNLELHEDLNFTGLLFPETLFELLKFSVGSK